jgi:uncharacterized protein (DUF952 family)
MCEKTCAARALGQAMTTSRQFVFKVAPRAAWEDARGTGRYAGSADDLRDGFIHLSLREQLADTLAKHFRGQHDLVLIQFETASFGDALRWEASRGGALFPHLYAELPTANARAVHELALGIDGVPVLPEEFAAC